MELSPEQKQRIREKAEQFVERWTRKYYVREREESQTFINEFFGIFNIDRLDSNIYFERSISKSEDNKRIDVLWPGVILIENKSSGENLNRAFDQQAREYFYMLRMKDRPKCILVNNFHIFKLYVIENQNLIESECFHIKKLPGKINLFYYFFDHSPSIAEQPVERETGKSMHEIKYTVLKFALASGLSLVLGYLISDGQPREYLETFIGGSAREESTRQLF